MISFSVPLPPSVNALYVNVPGRGRVRSAAYEAWLTEAGYLVNLSKALGPITGPYSLVIKAGKPNHKNGQHVDLGNIEKALSDLLKKHCCIRDDKDAQRIELSWSAEIDGVFVQVSPTTFVPPKGRGVSA